MIVPDARPAAPSVLAELDRLHSVLAAPREDAERREIIARLEALLVSWWERQREAGGPVPGDVLETPSDDEIFRVIDELGLS